MRWHFYVVDDAGNVVDRWSVGSYESTTAMLRETGDIKPDERLFHLDHYPAAGGHGTFAFYVNQPAYEKARADFIAGVTGRAKPMSTSGPYRPATRPATQPAQPRRGRGRWRRRVAWPWAEDSPPPPGAQAGGRPGSRDGRLCFAGPARGRGKPPVAQALRR